MTNESALAGLLDWWQAIPEKRRPGHLAQFSIGEARAELYILGLREAWASYGPGVLNLSTPHHERLRQDGLNAIADLCSWLDTIESSVRSTCTHDDHRCRDTCSWVARWRSKLHETAGDPLAEPFGSTLGASPESNLLTSFRWWADGVETPQGPGGPLSDLPDFVGKVCTVFQERPTKRSSALGATWSMAITSFPESVRQLQFAQAYSPSTAVHVLNWLLSERGVLRPSRYSPSFAGPSAVPYARPWLDQMDAAFHDWHAKKCTGPINSAYLQLACPVVPSAYIVAPGAEPLAIRGINDRIQRGLATTEGQAATFEFLLHQVARLQRRRVTAIAGDSRIPRLTIVDGERRGRFALEVGSRLDKRSISKGAAALLFALGRDGERFHVPARHLMDLRQVVPEIVAELDAGKKVKNHYTCCKSAALRGQVSWDANAPQPQT
jgi:hypothetical protein